MKRCSLWAKLALLVCTAITVVSASHTSLAYITARSNTVHNSFRAVYLPPQDIRVPVRIQKSMLCTGKAEIGPGGFDFHLLNADTGEVTVLTTDEDGRSTAWLIFTAGDAGKTFHYSLYEIDTGIKNVRYDERIYSIGVTPVLNGMHEMSAQLTVDGEPVAQITAEYVNGYSEPMALPDTGDHAQLLLWAAMLISGGAGFILLGKKRSIFRRLQWIERKSGF